MLSTLHISLSAPLKKWVEEQVEEKGFSTVSEFMRDLLRQQQARENARASVDKQLLEGLNSGPSTRMTRKDWQRIRAEGMKLTRERSRVSVR